MTSQPDPSHLTLPLGSVLTFSLLALAGPLPAQEVKDTFPGVSLGLIYESRLPAAVAIKPFTPDGSETATQAEAILSRDLRYSDRFTVLDSLPAALVGERIDYGLWDQLGATWLVAGQLERTGDGLALVLELHDVIYAELKERERFPLPNPSAPDFRMAVHRVSDRAVEWITGEPGCAASRIAFSMNVGDGVQELYLVDSDGEDLHRLTDYGDLTMSPAWHPSGERLAFNSFKDGMPALYELNLNTGSEKRINLGHPGQPMTPAYDPEGRRLAFSIYWDHGARLYTFDMERDCCLSSFDGGRWEDISPSFSPDGSRMVFNSSRLGSGTPQVYLMPASGGEVDLLSPYQYGTNGYYTSPDWSPVGNRVVFHGRTSRTGPFQILVAEVQGRRGTLLLLTNEGNNEDPSWAPDGRHLVFAGERSYGSGLFVVDAVSGNTRLLVPNIKARNPEWSPPLRAPRDE